MPRLDNLSAEELEQIKRFIEETDIYAINDEMRALVEEHWPWLLEKLGCLTCNLWAAAGSKRWKRLSEADLRALHLLRHS
jgi:hypothetical protein